MGITIHYKGKLNSISLIDPFLDEVEDIATSMEWNSTSFPKPEENELNLKGLFITPHPNSEFLQFMVDEKGHLRNAIMFEHFGEDNKTTYLNHIKTQFAPIEIHIAIIKLLEYLKDKYVANLEVWDEGDYWQTGNSKILLEKFDFLNKKLDEFGEMLESIQFDKNETVHSIADKIETLLIQHRKK